MKLPSFIADRKPADPAELDRKLILAASVLLIIASFCIFLQYCYFMWDELTAEYGGFGTDMLLYLIYDNANTLALLVGGILLFRFRKTVPMYRAAASVSIILGLNLLHFSPIDTEIIPFDYLMLVISDLLSYGLLLFGALLWFGGLKYAPSLGYIAAFYAGYEIFTYRYNIFSSLSGTDVLMYVIPYLPYTVMILLFAFMMFRRSVRQPGLITRLTDSANRVTDAGYTEADTYMVRKDLLDLCGLFDAPSESDSGITEIERRYRLISSMRSRTMVVRRWQGEDFLRATMCSESGSFDGFRFMIRSIVPETGTADDCGSVLMFGETGTFVRMIVRDREMTFQELSAMEFAAERSGDNQD